MKIKTQNLIWQIPLAFIGVMIVAALIMLGIDNYKNHTPECGCPEITEICDGTVSTNNHEFLVTVVLVEKTECGMTRKCMDDYAQDHVIFEGDLLVMVNEDLDAHCIYRNEVTPEVKEHMIANYYINEDGDIQVSYFDEKGGE